MSAAAFAFAQVRLHAHHARRLNDDDWRALEVLADYPVFVQHAREATRAGRWLQTLGARSSPAVIERELRRAFREYVVALSKWEPRPWQAAVRWSARLLDLPVLLADRARVPGPWREGAEAQAILEGEGDSFRREVALGMDPMTAWMRSWRLLWPEQRGRRVREMEQVAALITAHVAAFAALPPGSDGWAARRGLERELILAFRRLGFGPGALFVHLALTALELERLRGGLVWRAALSVGAAA